MAKPTGLRGAGICAKCQEVTRKEGICWGAVEVVITVRTLMCVPKSRPWNPQRGSLFAHFQSHKQITVTSS